MDWEQEVADIIQEEVYWANGGHWPLDLEEVQHLAERFGFKVCFYLHMPISQTVIVRRVIHLPIREVDEPVYRHELAEAAQQWEGRAPFCIPPQDMRSARHRVARLVEKL